MNIQFIIIIAFGILSAAYLAYLGYNFFARLSQAQNKKRPDQESSTPSHHPKNQIKNKNQTKAQDRQNTTMHESKVSCALNLHESQANDDFNPCAYCAAASQCRLPQKKVKE